MSRNPGNERDHRWLIDISPIEMLATSEVIKFVPKNSVTAAGDQMKDQLQAREAKNERFARQQPGCRSCVHEVLVADAFLFSSMKQRI